MFITKANTDEPYANPRSCDGVERLLVKEVHENKNFVFAAVKGNYGKEVTAMYKYAVLITTSVKNNSIKNNYTIDELHWKLYPKGNIADWDGLTSVFLKLVNSDKELLKDAYIKNWYKVSKSVFLQHGLL